MFPMYEKSKRELTQDEINGVNALYGPKAPIAIEGDALFCSNGVYGLPQFSSSKPIQWNVTPSNVVSITNYGSNGIKLDKINSGTVNLTASICGNILASKTITVGT